MPYRLISILVLVLILASCRVKDTHETQHHTDSLRIERGRALELFQIVERFDTLGRLTERQTTEVLAQDSARLERISRTKAEHREHRAPAPRVAASWVASWVASWRALLLIFGLGLILGAYAWHRFRGRV